MKSLLCGIFILGLLASPVYAGTFSFDFNNRSTQFGVSYILQSQPYGDTVIKGRYLYNEKTDTNLAGFAFGVLGEPGNVEGLKLGIDVALNGGTTAKDQDLLAFGIGLLGEYTPPILSGLGLNAKLVYSPEIFTFIDAESYFEWGFGASYQLLPQAQVTLAYQNIQLDFPHAARQDLDETLRVGVVFNF